MTKPKVHSDLEINIAKIMTPKVSTVFLHAGDSVRQGVEVIRRHGFTSVPVLGDQDQYLGAITEGDLLRHMTATGTTDLREQEKYRIGDLFRKDFCRPLTIQASGREIVEAALMQNFIPIVDDRGCLCGIVTRRSLIACLTEKLTGDVFEIRYNNLLD